MRLSEHKVDAEVSFTKLFKAGFGGGERKGVATTTAANDFGMQTQFVETRRRFAHAERRNHATNGSSGSALGNIALAPARRAAFFGLRTTLSTCWGAHEPA
jgi:hypothetical protein